MRWTRRRADEDFAREIDAHIALETDRLIGEGLSAADARDAAMRKFGNATAARERFYETQRVAWLDQLRQDIRVACRSFARTPGFSLVVVLTLALGIGANTAIFSVINAVLLRPLPYADPERLVRIVETPPPADQARGGPPRAGISVAELVTIGAETQTLSHVGMSVGTGGTMTARDRASRVTGLRMSAGMFPLLGVAPLLGRTFEPRDTVAGGDAVIVLSHALWQREFGADPDVIGRSFVLDTRTYSIVGVMPPHFRFPDAFTEFWMPYVFPTGRGALLQRTSPFARLKDGVSSEAAASEIVAMLGRLRQTPGAEIVVPQVQVIRVHDQLVAPVRQALLVLAGAVGLVLLIGCVNVANLLLARTTAREREIAVRRALGASAGRLVRQMFTEAMLLALAGGVAATALAFGGVRVLLTLALGLQRRDLGPGLAIPRLDEVGLDGSVFVFTLTISLLVGVLFGLAPALRHARTNPTEALGQGGNAGASGFHVLRRHPMQGALVVAEMAMALMLLIGGGLLIRSLVNLTSVDPGYEPSNILTFQIAVPGGRAAAPRVLTLAEDLVDRLSSVAGVRAAGYAEGLPMVQMRTGAPLRTTPGLPDPLQPPSARSGPPPQFADTHHVSRDFLPVMGMHVVEGRGFTADDGAGQPQVVLINRTLARTPMFAERAIGHEIYVIGPRPWQVIGIVDDVRQYGLDQEPAPQVFLDLRQLAAINPAVPPPAAVEYFAVRTESDPLSLVPAVRAIVQQLDQRATVERVATMEQLVSNSVVRPRLYAVLLGVFSVIAVALAAIGVYGVLMYLVSQRTREIGIRMALGAERSNVVRLVIGQSLVLTVAGGVLGVSGAAALTRYLDTMLFGLTPLDTATFVAVSALFGLVATLAAYVPAHRAARVDPLVALRYE